MRFVTFTEGGATRAGVLDRSATSVADLAHADYRAALGGAAPQMLAMIENGLEPIVKAISKVQPSDGARLRLSQVRLEAPLPRPGRVVGAAHNYRCALAERGMPAPDAPVLFEKDPDTIVGPEALVLLPTGGGGCTYEAELAVVIGRKARNVSPDTALRYVAGYSIFNDISASEIIRADGGFKRGKNFPTFGPFGPYMATVDEIPDPQALDVSLEMDGKVMQRSNTAQMLFSVAELISILSHERALAPGDVIATGTPAGVAPVQNPPTWIPPGAVMTARVAELGALTNTAVSAASAA